MDIVKCDLLEKTINNLSINILDSGCLLGDSEWKHYKVSSPYNRLYFVTAGEAFVQNAFHKVCLVPGNLYLIPLHTAYDYICDRHIQKFYIHFRIELFAGRDMFEASKTCLSLPFDQFSSDKIIEYAQSQALKDVIRCKSIFYHAVCRFLDLIPGSIESQAETASKYHTMLSYIKDNISARLRVSRVVEHTNLSASALAKNFKKDFGIPLKCYMDKMIVQQAKEKLLLTDLSVKEIAASLEFSDEFYFSRFFKKHTGLSPLGYRKDNKIMF